jgi:hypothetical protein
MFILNKFHTKDPQTIGATAQKLIFWATMVPWLVHLIFKLLNMCEFKRSHSSRIIGIYETKWDVI